MYALHTTDAFILTHYPQGESDRVYKLFTRDKGLVYVHGRSVREIANRNRYALTTHSHVSVTMVRGKGSWRLTGIHAHGGAGRQAWRRVLAFSGGLLAQNDPHPTVFDLLVTMRQMTDTLDLEQERTLEALVMLRVLSTFGYVARPRASIVDKVLATSASLHEQVCMFQSDRTALVRAANSALQVASQQ
jgi:recombinational DNA repair protein (RecF pathway)